METERRPRQNAPVETRVDSPIPSGSLQTPNVLNFVFTLSLAWAWLWGGSAVAAAEAYSDRFVWVFGWGLEKENDVAEINRLIDTAGKAGLNGAVASFGFDTLCKQDEKFFQNLRRVQQSCEREHIELIPALFSVGYGGGALAHNRNLAEGLPVENALFIAGATEARFAPEKPSSFVNGGFEEFKGKQAVGFTFHDKPGEISFRDEAVKHSGQASIRLENFQADPYGHARVMQSIQVQPHRCYRATLWVKTQDLQPANAFRTTVLTGERDLAPREFHVPSTTDWRKVSFVFNTLDADKVGIYAGLWGGKSGKVWLDDWTVEEIGPVNVLNRPGTPTSVRSEDGKVIFEEGKDYAALRDPNLQPYYDDKEALPLKLVPGGRIHEGDRLRVSWYHSMIIHDSQVGCCMAEPQLYEIMDHEAKLLAEKVNPRRVLLNMDEVRMGGTCRACQGKDMAKLLGECITRQAQTLRKYIPGVQVYVWSDMLDPNHNAHGNYYLVQGDYTGSWKYVPKDLVIAIWGGAPRAKSLQFFSGEGFQTLVACYYDADDLNEVKGWLQLAQQTKGVRGFMYTPWEKKYSLLPQFGELLSGTR
jgi:hypothetical protein